MTCERRKGTKHSRPRSESPHEFYSRLLTVFSIFTWFSLADFDLPDAFLFHGIFSRYDNRCFALDDKRDKL